MADEQRNTLDPNPLFVNNAQSAYHYPIPMPISDNYGNTHMQLPIPSPSIMSNECSPLKKQADTLNLEFKKLIEDLDHKISSLPSGNFFLSQGNDLKFGDNFGSNVPKSNDVIQPEFKGREMPSPGHRFDDIHSIKDRINLSERTTNVFERDVAKIQQQIDIRADQMKVKPNENEPIQMPTTTQNWHPQYDFDQTYQRGRLHPFSTHNMGRALKDDDYIRSSRFMERQHYGVNLQQNKIETSLSDSETVTSGNLQFTQRKSIKELAQSWSRASSSSSFNDLKQTVIVKPCKAHICGKQGCRYHTDCMLQRSTQSFSEMNSPVTPNRPIKTTDNTTTQDNQIPNELLKTKLMKGKQKHIFGRRCAC